MEPKFDQIDEAFGAALICLRCSGNHLHHEKVEVFERQEDAEKGIHVSVAGGVAAVDSDLTGNPSRRRHG